jgi:hypothetical protein
MDLETAFSASGALAMAGWVALAAAPLAPRLADLVAGRIIPGALSLGYAVLIAVHWAQAPGGFGTLAEVQALFTHPGVALAGWVHYLAFDLFVGAWIVARARAEGLAHLAILPILPLTLLFGPAGLAAFFALRLARAPFARSEPEA